MIFMVCVMKRKSFPNLFFILPLMFFACFLFMSWYHVIPSIKNSKELSAPVFSTPYIPSFLYSDFDFAIEDNDHSEDEIDHLVKIFRDQIAFGGFSWMHEGWKDDRFFKNFSNKRFFSEVHQENNLFSFFMMLRI